jgi:ubiquitin carboxyl-terminal hydrolase L3
MATIIKACSSLSPDERFSVLENSAELEDAYATVAQQGTSRVPDNAEDEVDFHYVCFVKSPMNGRSYELDGDRRGPIDRGLVLGPGEDVLAPGGVDVIRGYMERERGNLGFNLIALMRCE